MRKNCLFLIIACLFQIRLPAQDIPQFVFGEITPADFALSFPAMDSGMAAIVLADIGSASLEGYESGFRVVFKRHTRIKILNRNGYDAAKVTLRYSGYDNEAGTPLKSLQAATYNLEDGKVVQTLLDEKDCFLDKPEKGLLEEKFTFPNIKEGSIIEWTYSINSSSYFQLHPWYFQGKYPVLWSAYTVSMPDVFNYVFLLQGHHPLYKKTSETGKDVVIPGPGWNKAFLTTIGWIMKDVPPLKEEPFTSTLDNHIACVKFQLSVRPTNIGPESVLGTWSAANNRLLYSSRFGAPLAESNHWLKSEVKKITAGCTSDTAKARKLFAFVRDNLTAHGYGIFLRDDVSLKDVFKKRNGSIAEINLLLIAMLREEDIGADPVILSTRENGLTNAAYPLMDNFNNVIARVSFENTVYYLDASQPKMGFGKLPLACYNGHARAIAESPYAVYLEPDSLREFKMTSVYLSNNEKGGMTGFYTSTPGYYESLQLRNELEDSRGARFFRDVAGAYPYPVELDSAGIDSLTLYDGPVMIHYNLKLDPGHDNIIYFNPMLLAGMKENPFVSLTREYPVEMPYAKDEIYVLNMEVPNGYKINELPKSAKILLNGDAGFFEYGIAVNDNTLQLRSRILLKKAIFEPEDYTAIRAFFGIIVKKQNELIVFKKE